MALHLKTRTGILTTWLIFLATIASAHNFSFRKHQVNNGLSGNTVQCIMQDNQGFMWFGTQDGLNRFDGNNYKIFKNNPDDNHSIGNNFIRSLYQGDDNLIWVGTDQRLFIYNPVNEKFTLFEQRTEEGTAITSAVTAITAEDEMTLWIGTMSQGAFCYHKSTGTLVQFEAKEGNESINDNLVWRIYKDYSGTIWIGTRGGLSRYNKESKTFTTYGSRERQGPISDPEILSIFEDSDGDLWLGTWEGGLARYNKTTDTFTSYFRKDDSPYITHIRTIFEYEKNKLFIGSDDGLYLFDKISKNIRRIDDQRDQNSLSDQNIYAIYGDKEGGIWIGTYFGGVNYLSPNSSVFEHYYPNYKKNSMSGKAVSQFLEDPKGNLWIATEDGGLNYFNTKTRSFTTYLPDEDKPSISYTNLHALILDRDKLWIGTFSRGLDVLDLKTGEFTNFRHQLNNPNSIDDNCIFALYKTVKDEIFVGTPFGLSRYNRDKNDFSRISQVRGFVYDMAEDHLGQFWIACYGQGVYKYDPDTDEWSNYLHDNNNNKSLCFNKIVDIFLDEKQRLWFSSEGGGLCKYNFETNDFTTIDQTKGLPNNMVYGVLDDKYGNIWVSTNKGISRINLTSQNIKNYTSEDGLQSNQFNYRSSYKASDGKFYFGGINGFNAFYPDQLTDNEYIPPVLITGFKLLDAENPFKKDSLLNAMLNTEKQITLRHNQASFRIDFVSLSFRAQGKNQYAFQLENLDNKWIPVENQNFASYINLNPGKYVFRVKGSNNDGLWNQKGDFLKIEILPPMWKSNYAYIFYVLLFLTVAFFSFRYYQRILRKKQQLKLEDFRVEKEKEMYASKINFFTNIAHEIRTPVSLIKAPLESILNGKESIAAAKENLAVIDKNADRLLNLVNQLLDFRKIERDTYSLHFEPVNINNLITDICYRFKSTASQKNISLNPVFQKSEVIKNADKEALTKILSNLLTNALKYAKTSIEIRLNEIDESDYLEITITDDGMGIPEAFREKVFEPFFQIEGNGNADGNSGTGIGLAFSRQLVEKHNGNLFVRETTEGHCEFVVRINARDQNQNQLSHEPENPNIRQAISPLHAVEMEKPLKNDKPVLLIVEDNEDLCNFLERSLKLEYQVLTAPNGKQALHLLEHHVVDIIVSDVVMPGIDGLELVKEARGNEQFSHIPIVLLSARTNLETKVNGLDSGADAYIEKPFSLEYLKAQINSLIKNRVRLLEKFANSPFIPYGSIANNKKDEDFLNRLNDEIDHNISDADYSIEKLAAALSMSRSNLQRKIKGISGMTPNDYIRVLKLKKAARLIMEGEYRINEISYIVGFNSPSYFSKCFQKQFGALPSEFVNHNEELSKPPETT